MDNVSQNLSSQPYIFSEDMHNREGAGAVHNYLSHLEKDENGRYYLNYDKISDPRQREMFKRIETRLRKFEK